MIFCGLVSALRVRRIGDRGQRGGVPSGGLTISRGGSGIHRLSGPTHRAQARQTQKKLDLATQQPPPSANAEQTGAPPAASEVNIMERSNEQFEPLTDAEMAKMRGDYVA